MTTAERRECLQRAVRSLQGYIAGGARFTGLFEVAWDRLNACGADVDLRQEPTEANARALLWTAEQMAAKAGMVFDAAGVVFE
jgi:hypothetical protein